MMERQDPLQLSLDFGADESVETPSQPPKPEVVCLDSYRKERAKTVPQSADTGVFYQRILDSISHFA